MLANQIIISVIKPIGNVVITVHKIYKKKKKSTGLKETIFFTFEVISHKFAKCSEQHWRGKNFLKQ